MSNANDANNTANTANAANAAPTVQPMYNLPVIDAARFMAIYKEAARRLQHEPEAVTALGDTALLEFAEYYDRCGAQFKPTVERLVEHARNAVK